MIGKENVHEIEKELKYYLYIIKENIKDRAGVQMQIWLTPKSLYALNLIAVSFSYAAYPCEYSFSLRAVFIWFSYTKFTGELDLFLFFMEKICHKKKLHG